LQGENATLKKELLGRGLSLPGVPGASGAKPDEPELKPSVFSDSSRSPSFLRTTAARKALTVCGCQPVERVTVAMLAPFDPHSSASTHACFESARPVD
jgi:hypothetical protein